MLRRKLKTIALLMFVVLTLSIPIVRAENETAEQTDENITVEDQSQEAQAISNDSENSDQAIVDNNMKKGDVYLSGDNITIDYIVDGNLFVVADNVTINSQIGGDAFICAKTITIENQGYIFSNLFACTQNLTISGVVYDVYATAQDVTINGYVYRDVRISSNTVNFNGMIGRNAFVTANDINFAQLAESEDQVTSQAMIDGNFNYYSPQEASIPERETVGGDINFKSIPRYNSNTIQEYILSFGQFVITVIIIWLLCLWLAPKFLNNTNELLSKKLLPVIGYGILTPIVIVIASILLFLLGITSKIALLGLILLILLITISSSIFAIAVNRLLCAKLKIEKTLQTLGVLIISSAIIWLLTIIPYVGILLKLIFSMFGLGMVIAYIFPTRKKKNKNNQETKKEKPDTKN